MSSSAKPSSSSSSKRARRSDHKRGSQNNCDQLNCDSCNNIILSANHADHHVRNTPCNHNICMLCVIKTNMRRGCSDTSGSGCCCQVESCKKYITSCQYFRAGSPGEIIRNERDENNNVLPSFDDLGTDVLANIFGYLSPEDIMRARLNKKMGEAAKTTIVPPTEFIIYGVRKYTAMTAMTTALPNLQHLSIWDVGHGHKYNDGEDPHEIDAAQTANLTPLNIDIISNFRKLTRLNINRASLNGRYPALFNFPLLQKLIIFNCDYLKWDLEMLEGLPLLKVLDCADNNRLSGSLFSLRVLKDTLEKVEIIGCRGVEGNFMDLADFPRLKKLDLISTAVRGDIRNVGEGDFPALEILSLPEGVYGGRGHALLRISDAPEVISTLHSIRKQRPTLLLTDWFGELSEDSPDWYYVDDDFGYNAAPFYIVFVQAGPRIGYRWQSDCSDTPVPCEVNWLDPEPGRESNDYEKYTKELQEIEGQVDVYRGFHQPPTEEECHHLWAEQQESSNSSSSNST